MQTVAGAGGTLRGVLHWEQRALRRIGVGLLFNLALAFGWLLFDPLEYTAHTEIPVIVVYFVTFVLADSATTNMLADQAAVRSGRSTGFGASLGVVVARNVTLFLALGVPLVAATVTLVALTGHGGATPIAVSSVLMQVFVWLGICSILAALFPVTAASPLAWWRDRRNPRVTAWRAFAALAPYALLWVLVPADGRRRLPGMGAVHRRTTGAQPLDHVHQAVTAVLVGLLLWGVGIGIGAGIVRIRNWRPRA
ncbi:hypothetical protein FK529_16370 [Tsukamurella asaccharolytica]|uniref:Uncharacterized protein n=1 Tax=Tsukamurella asaccharolytica TaxID=2592067 RepID=A0A5C5R7I9_9ACTN|nr:hypothetical protein [Tsukamurella asaccharolytica]TWS18273.1 hypothetical protein FK529_16370 [Tsukamurella asaccharolytica]